jgi:hypothetical protein
VGAPKDEKARDAIDHFKAQGGTERQLKALVGLLRTANGVWGWVGKQKRKEMVESGYPLTADILAVKYAFFGDDVDPAEIDDELHYGEGW